jgi:hypothetical protein
MRLKRQQIITAVSAHNVIQQMVGQAVDLTTTVKRTASRVTLMMLRLDIILVNARIVTILISDGRTRTSTMQVLRIANRATQVMLLPIIIQGNVQIAMT